MYVLHCTHTYTHTHTDSVSVREIGHCHHHKCHACFLDLTRPPAGSKVQWLQALIHLTDWLAGAAAAALCFGGFLPTNDLILPEAGCL